MTRFGSVGWIHEHQRNASGKCLVAQELAQLVECPTVGSPAFRLASWLLVRAFPDASQVFKRNRSIVGLRLRNKLFADHMVGVGSETFFSAGQPF
jgi:hypothetical protein